MIEIKFKEICETHRFTVQLIHNETGINRNTLSELHHGNKINLTLDTLDRLYIFFNKYIECTTSDLIEFVNENSN